MEKLVKVILVGLLINILGLGLSYSMNEEKIAEETKYMMEETNKNEKLIIKINKAIAIKNQQLINDLLHESIDDDNSEAVELLMQNGADIEYEEFLNKTPLFNAVYQIEIDPDKNLDIIKYLLNYNPNVNSSNFICNTILHKVSLIRENTKAIKIIKLLLNHGLNINSVNSKQSTPLHFSIENGNLETSQFLIDLGANLNSQDSNKDTCLHLAIDKKKL